MSLHTFTIIYFTVNVSRDSKLQSPSSSDPPISPVPIFHPATGDRPGEGRARPGCSCRRPDGNAGGGGRGEGSCRAQSRDTPRACGTRGGPFIGLCAARRRVVAKVKATARTARRACILPARSPPRAPPRRPPPRPPPPPPQPPQRPATAAVTVAPPPCPRPSPVVAPRFCSVLPCRPRCLVGVGGTGAPPPAGSGAEGVSTGRRPLLTRKRFGPRPRWPLPLPRHCGSLAVASSPTGPPSRKRPPSRPEVATVTLDALHPGPPP